MHAVALPPSFSLEYETWAGTEGVECKAGVTCTASTLHCIRLFDYFTRKQPRFPMHKKSPSKVSKAERNNMAT